MEEYQQRVIHERSELEDKLTKLDEFRKSTSFLAINRDQQILLNRQSVIMHGYVEVLTERIAAFNL
jgi:hypothetical protein